MIRRWFLLAAAVLASGVLTASASSSSRPTLRVVAGTGRLVVRGSGFYARESVRVTVTASMQRTKVVRTLATGTFTADFGTMFVNPCDAFSVKAVGSRGDRALLKIPARQCIPQ